MTERDDQIEWQRKILEQHRATNQHLRGVRLALIGIILTAIAVVAYTVLQ